MKTPAVKKGRCVTCGWWQVCREVGPGNWSCTLCIEHIRADHAERDRVERRVREQLETKEERSMSGTINMVSRPDFSHRSLKRAPSLWHQ